MVNWKPTQNADGGWSYSRGGSWTEPTVFALLAQAVRQPDPSVFGRGVEILRSMQRKDGGWAPRPDVEESTWVTALAALLPEGSLGRERIERAVAWLLGQTGRESSWSWKLSQWLHGNREQFPEGVPWIP